MLFEKRPTEQGIKNLLLDLKAVMENPLYKDATLEGNEIKRRIGNRMMDLEQYGKWEGEKEND